MAAIGVLTLELRIESSHSLKEKRHVVQSLKDRLRHKFNVSVAEIDHQDLWQRATIAAVTVSSDRENAEKVLRSVEEEAAGLVGSALVDADGGVDRVRIRPQACLDGLPAHLQVFMDVRRILRVSEAVKEELNEIIGFEMEDPRLLEVEVTDVQVSPDSRHAAVKVALRGDQKRQKQALAALEHASGFLRRELALRLTTPAGSGTAF